MALGAIEDQTFLDVNDAWLATTGYLVAPAVIRSRWRSPNGQGVTADETKKAAPCRAKRGAADREIHIGCVTT
jgi:hypothetical protein